MVLNCSAFSNLETGFNQLCIVANSASNEVMCDSQSPPTILQLLSAKNCNFNICVTAHALNKDKVLLYLTLQRKFVKF